MSSDGGSRDLVNYSNSQSTKGNMLNHLKRRDNISTIFLLPSLGIEDTVKAQFYKLGFENTYLFSDTYKYPFEVLFLVFKFPNFSEEMQRFVIALKRNENFIESKELSAERTLFVFKIPSKYIKDYKMFLEGKYSKFSTEYKMNFPMKVYKADIKGTLITSLETGRFIVEDSMFYHIFNRTDYLKNIYRDFLKSNDYEEIELPDELYDKYILSEEKLKE